MLIMITPAISVIMPAYNCAAYLNKAVESVLKQKCDWELIIIDDASTDNTLSILRPYLRDKRIRCLRNNRNLGAAQSRNIGVSEAKGRYIAYLDADDWWREQKLEMQIRLLEGSNASLVCTGRELYRQSGEPYGCTISVPESIYLENLLRTNSIACSSVLLRRETALEFPMEHDEYHEDYLTWLKIVNKYGRACGLNKPLLCSRMTPGGKSRNKRQSFGKTYGVYRIFGLNRRTAVWFTGNHMVRAAFRYIRGRL